MRPTRSALYMPGANERALDKARGLDCDAVIFDLEDAVAPDAKDAARSAVEQAVGEGGYGHRERVLRINGLDTPWWRDDVAAAVRMGVDALLIPKVETQDQLDQVRSVLLGGPGVPVLWIMVETPLGVLNVRALVEDNADIAVLVMGTSDLTKELRARHTDDRQPMLPALGHCLLVARACERIILDGVHLDFRNQESFHAACVQGRDLGFDGKTLIHPTQVDVCNEVFGPSAAEIEDATQVRIAWENARAEGKGVAVLDGRLIENLHAAEADRVLAFAQALAER